MAKPRVFVSSTYFDLKTVRADIEFFVRDLGYDAILHERGAIPYGKQEALEQYCYKEIENCDVLVSIIGGRFGSESYNAGYSISQTELRVALELQRQVYVFVERDVYHEYRTYEKNKGASLTWASVDDVRIFQFLDEIYKLKNNNPVQPFETSFQITQMLKDQWAGLFQRLLAQSVVESQGNLFIELRHSLETARSLVEVISARTDEKDSIVENLVLTNHPIFSAVRTAMNVPYRVLFYDLDEMNKWLEARSYKKEDESLEAYEDKYEWINTSKVSGNISTLFVSKVLFDEHGKLKPYLGEWDEGLVAHNVRKPRKKVGSFDDLDDDIPF